MKDKYFEYYTLSSEELPSFWKDCLLVLDTNILLNLYRLTESTRNDILNILKKFNDKLWMPFQVGFEYHENREGVIESISDKKLKDHVYKTFESLNNTFKTNHSRNPYITIDAWEKKIHKETDSFEKFIKTKYKEAPLFAEQDDILIALNKLFSGKVGDNPTKAELQRIYDEGKNRYASKIPPGYKDDPEKKGKGERHLYGDLIIWKEIIEKARVEKKNVFFVSDDRKEDWVRIINGEKKGPRRELLREFYDETNGQRVVILNQQQFIDFIHNLPEFSIKPKTLKEIEAIQTLADTQSFMFGQDVSTIVDYLNRNKFGINPSYHQFLQALDFFNTEKIRSILERTENSANTSSFITRIQEPEDNPGGEELLQEEEDISISSKTEEESV